MENYLVFNKNNREKTARVFSAENEEKLQEILRFFNAEHISYWSKVKKEEIKIL